MDDFCQKAIQPAVTLLQQHPNEKITYETFEDSEFSWGSGLKKVTRICTLKQPRYQPVDIFTLVRILKPKFQS